VVDQERKRRSTKWSLLIQEGITKIILMPCGCRKGTWTTARIESLPQFPGCDWCSVSERTRITGRANASRRGSPTPTCRKANHTPIT